MSQKIKFQQAYYFSGFDPINSTQIKLGIRLRDQFKLQKVYFIPERVSSQTNYTHLTHRLNLLDKALKIHHGLQYHESNQKNLNLQITIFKLQKSSNLSLMMIDWALIKNHLIDNRFMNCLLKNFLIVSLDSRYNYLEIDKIIKSYNLKHYLIWQVDNLEQAFDSKMIYTSNLPSNILSSSRQYIIDHWLYLKIGDFFDFF